MIVSGIEPALAAQVTWQSWPATRRGETLAAMAHHLPEQLAARAHAWAGRVDKIYGQHHQGVPGELSYRVREPLGVVAVVAQRVDEDAFTDLVFAALACGNAVVAVAGQAMLPHARKLAGVADSSGIPGLVTVATGDEAEAVAACEAVAALQLVGEEHDARRLAALAWPRPVRLHVGSRHAYIVLTGSDVHGAAEAIAQDWPEAVILAEHGVAAELNALLASARSSAPARADTGSAPGAAAEPSAPGASTKPAAPGAAAEPSTLGATAQPTELGGVESTASGDVVGRGAPGAQVWAGAEVTEFSGDEELLELTGDGSCGPAVSLWARDLGRMLGLANTLRANDIACNLAGPRTDPQELIETLTRARRVSVRYR